MNNKQLIGGKQTMANELLNLNTANIEPSVEITLGGYEFKNKDEIAKFLKGAEKYKGIIVTNDEDYKSSKKLRADLKKVSDKINRHRIDTKEEMMTPINDFETEMKELGDIVNNVWKDVDKSVKDFETKERDNKTVIIDELIKEFSDGYRIEIPKQWYNRTKTTDDIRKEILDLVMEAKDAEKRKADEIKHIEKACQTNNLTAGGYITLLETGMDVALILIKITEDGKHKRELERQQAEYNAQQATKEEVKEVKRVAPQVTNEPIISQVIEMEATPSQFNELIQEMKRIGVKFVRVVDLDEREVKAG